MIIRRLWSDMLEIVPFNVVLSAIMWLIAAQLTYGVASGYETPISYAASHIGVAPYLSLAVFYLVAVGLMIPRPPMVVYLLAFAHLTVFSVIMIVGSRDGFWPPQTAGLEATLILSLGVVSLYTLRILEALQNLNARLRLAEKKIDKQHDALHLLLDEMKRSPDRRVDTNKIISIIRLHPDNAIIGNDT